MAGMEGMGMDFFGGGAEGELINSDDQSDEEDDDIPDLDDIPEQKKAPSLSDAQKADKFNEFLKAQNQKAEEALLARLKKEGKLK